MLRALCLSSSLTLCAALLVSLLPVAAAAAPHPCRVESREAMKAALDYRKSALAVGNECSKTGGNCAAAQDAAVAELEALGTAHEELFAVCGSTSPGGGSATGALVLNEIDYDQAGTDLAEFVEIFNGSGSPAVLDGLALIFFNGAATPPREYLRVPLSGSLAAGAYAVVAAPGVSGIPAGTLKFAFPASGNNIQNGPDAVGLVETATGAVRDFLSYEGPITKVKVDGLDPIDVPAALSTPLGDADGIPGSLIRFPNGADTGDATVDWRFTRTPTPGAANVHPAP